MTVDFLPLDVDEIKSMFYLQDGELYRRSSTSRFDGLYVDDQKMVRVGDARPTVNRVKYILQNGVNPSGEVILNDHGTLVDLQDNHLRMVIVRRDYDNVMKRYNKYFGRYIDANGVRISKSFDTYEDAREYSKSKTIEVWGKEALRLGFKLD